MQNRRYVGSLEMVMSFDDCLVTGRRPVETWRSEGTVKSLPDAEAAQAGPDLEPDPAVTELRGLALPRQALPPSCITTRYLQQLQLMRAHCRRMGTAQSEIRIVILIRTKKLPVTSLNPLRIMLVSSIPC